MPSMYVRLSKFHTGRYDPDQPNTGHTEFSDLTTTVIFWEPDLHQYFSQNASYSMMTVIRWYSDKELSSRDVYKEDLWTTCTFPVTIDFV